jgi:hypothetical protein|tara:strand:+ start:98 stop:436 length:339 start_codon:yes stop_codon:yes gene_type:complete
MKRWALSRLKGRLQPWKFEAQRIILSVEICAVKESELKQQGYVDGAEKRWPDLTCGVGNVAITYVLPRLSKLFFLGFILCSVVVSLVAFLSGQLPRPSLQDITRALSIVLEM